MVWEIGVGGRNVFVRSALVFMWVGRQSGDEMMKRLAGEKREEDLSSENRLPASTADPEDVRHVGLHGDGTFAMAVHLGHMPPVLVLPTAGSEYRPPKKLKLSSVLLLLDYANGSSNDTDSWPAQYAMCLYVTDVSTEAVSYNVTVPKTKVKNRSTKPIRLNRRSPGDLLIHVISGVNGVCRVKRRPLNSPSTMSTRSSSHARQ
ncbi:hypothetical protein BaRGS_00020100, partial [Batillaria attramentaria]